MGKRSQRHPVWDEKDKSGCMWGFISMFDFRHGRSAQKLLPDRKHGKRHGVGTVYSKHKFEMLTNLDEAIRGILDGGEGNALVVKGRVDKPSVKKLIEEEMFSDRNLKTIINNTETESKDLSFGNSGPVKTNVKRTRRARKKTCSMDSHDLDCDASSEFSRNLHLRHSSMSDLDLNKLVEDFCHHNRPKRISSVKDDLGSEVLPHRNHKHAHVEDKVKRAIENFVSDAILKDKDSVAGNLSRGEFIDALQVINSDQESLMKLLQDPDSFFRKHCQDLLGVQDCNQASETKLNEPAKGRGVVKETKHGVAGKQRNIFRKLKTREKIPSDGSETAEDLNTIVVLKPLANGLQNPKTESSFSPSPVSDNSDINKGPSARSGSHFSLTELKRKLKYAMGKDRHGYSDGKDSGGREKVDSKDNAGRKSLNKDHFFLERMSRPLTDNSRREKIGELKDSEMGAGKRAEISSISRVSSTFYVEAKKHLYEMLGNGDDSIKFPGQQVPKPLGRILSFSDYSSSICSPRRDREHGFATSQLRVSPKQISNNFVVDQPIQTIEHGSNFSNGSHENKSQALDMNPNLSTDPVDANEVEVTMSFIEDEAIIGGKLELRTEVGMLDASSGTRSFSIEENNDKHVVCNNIEDQRQSESSNQDISEDSQLLSPSHASSTAKIEECTPSDVSGQPSPISVLEPPFTEEVISPRCKERELVVLQPLRIQFEEYECSTDENCVGQNKLILDYVNAILQASRLSWDEMWTRCLTCDHILDPCLFDQVVYFPNQLCLDQKLLFDCIVEVLMEVCCGDIAVSPCVWFVNPSSKPVTNLQRLALEIWKQVCWHLLPLPLPHTLDQIVGKDMSKSREWVDRRFDVEDVGGEMSDVILLELMEDTLFFCCEDPTALSAS